jgi:hypothetical protein
MQSDRPVITEVELGSWERWSPTYTLPSALGLIQILINEVRAQRATIMDLQGFIHDSEMGAVPVPEKALKYPRRRTSRG